MSVLVPRRPRGPDVFGYLLMNNRTRFTRPRGLLYLQGRAQSVDPLTQISTRRTPQTERTDPEQVRNSAGGYVFQADDEVRIQRFLTLGTTGGTYYASEQKLTKDNTDLVLELARRRGTWLARLAREISVAGRAPRQQPAIFALAAVAGLGDSAARKVALDAVPDVCRTATTLFQFVTYAQQFRGWGRGMPQTTLIRQLPRLTRLGVLDGGIDSVRDDACAQLVDAERLAKARVHPVNLLVAMKAYAQGYSERSKHTWMPDRRIVNALDAAFYASFKTVRPTGKRILLALDVSSSMGYDQISGMPITPREASAALALVTMASEADVDVVGFTASDYWHSSTAITELPISPRQRLDDVVRAVSRLPFGRTDCALPFTWALEQNRIYDAVVVYTDNETYAGPVHVHQALTQYRAATGLPVRSVVVGMTANDITVAHPADSLSMDIAGFDSAVPNLISDFIRGDL